jgi:DNA-binding GntR family transcriptional regulator
MSVASVLETVEPIKQRATNLKVYDWLRDAIVAGRFKPGNTLSTRQFADALGVSQMPVREAFHRLVAEGALENRSNRTIGLPMLSLSEFNEISEIRVLLEGLAAKKAAARLDTEECSLLSQLAREMESTPLDQNNSDYLRLNREFHFTIYRGARSPELVRLIEQVWLRVGPFLGWISSPRDSRSRSNLHHRAVIKAIENRNGDAAAEAISNDVIDGAKVVRIRLNALQLPA